MAFRKSVDFAQKERDELPQVRPVIIYVVAPIHSADYTMKTSKYRHFKADPNLPNGVRKREGNPYQFVSIEAHQKLDRFETQLTSALELHKEATYKVVVLNGHATPEGITLSEEDGTQVLTGRHFAEIATAHMHGNHLQVLVFARHGHTFAANFYKYVQEATHKDTQKRVAITYFTSEASPLVWDTPATSGNVYTEVKSDIREFIHQTIEPNSPYKVLDAKVADSQCALL